MCIERTVAAGLACVYARTSMCVSLSLRVYVYTQDSNLQLAGHGKARRLTFSSWSLMAVLACSPVYLYVKGDTGRNTRRSIV